MPEATLSSIPTSFMQKKNTVQKDIKGGGLVCLKKSTKANTTGLTREEANAPPLAPGIFIVPVRQLNLDSALNTSEWTANSEQNPLKRYRLQASCGIENTESSFLYIYMKTKQKQSKHWKNDHVSPLGAVGADLHLHYFTRPLVPSHRSAFRVSQSLQCEASAPCGGTRNSTAVLNRRFVWLACEVTHTPLFFQRHVVGVQTEHFTVCDRPWLIKMPRCFALRVTQIMMRPTKKKKTISSHVQHVHMWFIATREAASAMMLTELLKFEESREMNDMNEWREMHKWSLWKSHFDGDQIPASGIANIPTQRQMN